MSKLTIKFSTYAKAMPPQSIRIKTPGWGGSAEKMQDGSDGQPWHCLPFVEGTTCGLELVYQFETECHVINDNGHVRFEGDFAREPGGMPTGAEFLTFSPKRAARYYLFNTGLDLQPPPGYVIRTEPHPRFYTDDTDTVPLALVGHLQNEWYPRLLFVVFRAPRPGQRHIFRKGEPFVQLLFLPQRMICETVRMTAEEETKRRALQEAIQQARLEIAENKWKNSDGFPMDNHYKVLARTFGQGGLAGVEEAVQSAAKRYEHSLPKTAEECLALGAQLQRERRHKEAASVYTHVLAQDPRNAEALSQLGICSACFGDVRGLELMAQAAALEPRAPRYQNYLGDMLLKMGRPAEAEISFRASLALNPNDPGIWSLLGVALASQGRTADGLQACRTALAIGGPSSAAHYRMGLIFAQQQQHAQACECYEAALALDQDNLVLRAALTNARAHLASSPESGGSGGTA